MSLSWRYIRDRERKLPFEIETEVNGPIDGIVNGLPSNTRQCIHLTKDCPVYQWIYSRHSALRSQSTIDNSRKPFASSVRDSSPDIEQSAFCSPICFIFSVGPNTSVICIYNHLLTHFLVTCMSSPCFFSFKSLVHLNSIFCIVLYILEHMYYKLTFRVLNFV